MNKLRQTCIIPGWSLVLFPGQGVPSCMTHPSSGTFCALATRPLIRILNSSYSLCRENNQENLSCKAKLTIKMQNLEHGKCYSYLHSPAIFHKSSLNFIFEVVDLLSKIPFWSSWLNFIFFTERNPFSCKFWCLRKSFKCQHSCSIVRDVARNFVNRIVNCKNG